jgi:hypothetical protein
MKKCYPASQLLLFFLIAYSAVSGQNIGIGTTSPHASAQLDISSSARGILIPRMTTSGINSIVSPAKGLMVYDSTRNQLMVNMGTAASPDWENMVAGSGWSLAGNKSINPTSQFVGTTDGTAFHFRVSNAFAGKLDAGQFNTFFGYLSGQNTMAGVNNTSHGAFALGSISTGSHNTAIGYGALLSTNTGSYNTAIGGFSNFENISGTKNIGLGNYTNYLNSAGSYNIAIGVSALYNNGADANIAIGNEAMYYNSGGTGNVAIGNATLQKTTNSGYNTVIGNGAGSLSDMGWNNIIIGANSYFGFEDGDYNTILIGTNLVTGASNIARIGNSFTQSIGGVVGWTTLSDGRFKKSVRENVKGLDFIMRLRPVTYHLDMVSIQNKLVSKRPVKQNVAMETAMAKAQSEQEAKLYSGFIAQEVEKAAQDAGYDFSGVDRPKNDHDYYGLRYDELIVPLIKAVQEQQQIIQKLQKRIDELEKRLENK